MATNPASWVPQNRTPLVPSELVAEYKRAHVEMIAAIEAMDQMALDSPPNMLKLSHTRLRITRAANESRTSLHKVLAILSRQTSPTIGRKVEVLEQMHAELREVARRHMARWSHAASHADWPAFYNSHTDVAQRWRDVIECERRFLYPML